MMDYDHIMQQKMWKLSHDRIGRCFCYMHAKDDLDHNILSFQILLAETTGVAENNALCDKIFTYYHPICAGHATQLFLLGVA